MKKSTLNEMAQKSGQTDATSATEDEISDTVSVSSGRRHFSSLFTIVLSAVIACGVTNITDWRYAAGVYRHLLSTTTKLWSASTEQKCVITLPDFLEDVLRPPINCSYCKGLDTIDKVFNLSAEDFEKNYAYTGRPVVAVDSTSAVKQHADFGFELFKNLSNNKLLTPCQFFPYKTEFNTLEEALAMDQRRAEMASGYVPWYIGWSNCEAKTINHLKKYISLPNFLPPLSDSKQTLWIFMGTPGHGAPMHIDKVGYPSWQTQINGYKKWTLRTPIECFFQCKRWYEVFMEPGSTIVLDTNIWYHETQTIGKDISITIGGEYD